MRAQALVLAAVFAAAPLLAQAQGAPSYPRKVLIWPGKVGGLPNPAVGYGVSPGPVQPISAPVPSFIPPETPRAYAPPPPPAPEPRPLPSQAQPFHSPRPEPIPYAAAPIAPPPAAVPYRQPAPRREVPPPLPPVAAAPAPALAAAPPPRPVAPTRTIYDAPPPAPVAAAPVPPAPQGSARRPVWDPHAGKVVMPQASSTPAPLAAAPAPRPGPVAAPPQQMAARRYSVHREFGMTPDAPPTPIPDSFFMEPVADDPAEPPAPEPRVRERRSATPDKSTKTPNDRLLGAEAG